MAGSAGEDGIGILCCGGYLCKVPGSVVYNVASSRVFKCTRKEMLLTSRYALVKRKFTRKEGGEIKDNVLMFG